MSENRPHILIKNEPPPSEIRQYNGGGSSFKRTDYPKQTSTIKKDLQQLKAYFAKTKDSSRSSKLYLRAEFDKTVKVSGSFEEKIKDNYLGSIVSSPNENTAHISIPKESFNDLNKSLETYTSSDGKNGKSKFSEIEHIGKIPFEEKASKRVQDLSDDDQDEFLVELYHDLSKEDVKILIEEIKKITTINFLESFESSEGALLKIKANKKNIKKISDDYISIQSIDFNDEIVVTQSIQGESINESTKILPNVSNAQVCIVDKGINDTSRLIAGSFIGKINPFDKDNKYPNNFDSDHGTFVASKIIFGDNIKKQYINQTFTPDVKVFVLDIRKFDSIGNSAEIKVDDLIKHIRSTVKQKHKEIRVYNLSIGCTKKTSRASIINDNEVHKLAAELDYLANEYDVLFVISAGNYPLNGEDFNQTSAYGEFFEKPEARILPPSEAMLALTVGSVAEIECDNSMAQKGDPSPFTRVGPGYSGYKKPDIAAHGGNLLNNHTHLNDIASVGIHGDGQSLAYGNGTSYAAPLISRFAAKILEQIPWAYSCLVKAIIIHVSQKPNHSEKLPNIFDLIGSGIPEWNKAFTSSPHQQTFLYQGELNYREMVRIPFFVPSCLTNRKLSKGQKKIKVRVTISFYPETRKSLKSGYCKSHIRTKIQKLDKNSNTKDIPYSKSKTIDHDRYSTVTQMEREFSSHIQSGEWAVFVAHESRWSLRKEKTKFAVVITIEDPTTSHGIDIFQGIQAEAKNRFNQTISIQESIRI